MSTATTLDPGVEITVETIVIPEDITDVACTWDHEELDELTAQLMHRVGRVFIRGCSTKVVAHVTTTRCGMAPPSFVCRNTLDFFNAMMSGDPEFCWCRGCVLKGMPDPDVNKCWKVVIL